MMRRAFETVAIDRLDRIGKMHIRVPTLINRTLRLYFDYFFFKSIVVVHGGNITRDVWTAVSLNLKTKP